MSSFTVDPEKCLQDKICVNVCPTNVIQMPSDGGVPEPGPDFETYCLACGHCVSVCPTAAFSMPWLAPEDCPSADAEPALTPAQAEQFLRSRRSIRNFTDELVAREQLEELLKIASVAPTGANKQLLHWTMIEDPQRVRQLAEMVIDWMRIMIKESPDQAEDWLLPVTVASWDRGREEICRNAPHVLVVHGDKEWGFGSEEAGQAIGYLQLYAPVLGLGTCWGGYLYAAANYYPPLFAALGLPENHKALGAVMVGHPRYRYHRLPSRNAPNVTWN